MKTCADCPKRTTCTQLCAEINAYSFQDWVRNPGEKKAIQIIYTNQIDYFPDLFQKPDIKLKDD